MFVPTEVKINHTYNDAYIVQLNFGRDQDGVDVTKEFAFEDFGDLVVKLGHFFGKWEDKNMSTATFSSERGVIVAPTYIIEELEGVADAAFD